ncbi:hypothetical protein Cgig2_001105 [Carnegiea gigantea]|uniref:PHD-type domain-containing protein n=1 Tax=Carnegiea gigantea TaxID=171969 RepID=A0A9Q1JX76_9CARY|nr:hypothetical protein Cgig2_001105 [Carnegiea gigantea]
MTYISAALEKGGVGALEIVAMDMKARGMFVCRTLSYKGVEFEVVEASLDAKMTEIYNKAAEFWAELHVELLTLVATYHEDKPASSFTQLWRLYWANHQRFFRHLCMSAKVPTVVRIARQALMENKCVVIDIQSTGEGLELEDFISGPRELLFKFVEANYPLPDEPETVPGIIYFASLFLCFSREAAFDCCLVLDDQGVKELPQKRHLAIPDISLRGRVRKAAKWKSDSDEECSEESQSDGTFFQVANGAKATIMGFLAYVVLCAYAGGGIWWCVDANFMSILTSAADVDNESSESDDEFQICEICSGEEDRRKLLKCTCCGQLVHPSCLEPPTADVFEEWTCNACKQKTEEYLEEHRVYIEIITKR